MQRPLFWEVVNPKVDTNRVAVLESIGELRLFSNREAAIVDKAVCLVLNQRTPIMDIRHSVNETSTHSQQSRKAFVFLIPYGPALRA